MVMFWIATAVLVAAAVALIMVRARSTSLAQDDDSARRLYQRQLAEIDDLVDRGLIPVAERQGAFSEAARRLVKVKSQPSASPASARSRLSVVAAGGVAAVFALFIYIVAGSPGTRDQPFASRLAAWQAMDPRLLDPASMAAVLAELAERSPGDARLQLFLGKARLAASDMPGAAEAFRTASRLAPTNAEPLVLLGEALTRSNGKVTPDARMAFRRAVDLEPGNASAQFFLGQAAIDAGDTAAGVASWRRLLADLPPNDPRRAYLEDQIRVAVAGEIQDAPQAAMIQGMVERQAAKLRQSPNDPEGWARLVRSYGVLGDVEAQKRALAQARLALKGQPAAFAKVEAEARPSPP
jgi:cytochrome c-type biogenesis protein CcmH